MEYFDSVAQAAADEFQVGYPPQSQLVPDSSISVLPFDHAASGHLAKRSATWDRAGSFAWKGSHEV